jgi:hypothetical protein
MLGVNFSGGNGAAVSDTERLSLPVTGQRDLAADHHDARIPIMGVVGVHHPGLEPTIEDLVTLASQIGFEFSPVHDKPSCAARRHRELTPRWSAQSGEARRDPMILSPRGSARSILRRILAAPHSI